MLIFTPDIPMSEDEFRQFRDFVYQHCGLHFTEDSKYLLEKRLAKRLQHHKMSNYKDYYYLLRYGRDKEQELAEVIDALTTNETYFFREEYQLKTLCQEVVPDICARKEKTGKKKLRIWSAGCSSGEEPYTLAMLMLQQSALQGWDIEVIGTDISHRVLNIARKGVYSAASFRTTEQAYLDRFFTPFENDKYRINDEVRDLVTISHLNLFDTQRVALIGKMDVILCRNVIIYFDQAAKKRVVQNFYDRLRPEGFLLLGHSESLMNISTSFALRHFLNDMVYQRPADAPLFSGGEL
ncbi:MAG: chemotaxis protein CheR [Desulfuromonas sp.]|nr:MAG: chemotaxis protein CheR [Desulfuromonas sp.]